NQPQELPEFGEYRVRRRRGGLFRGGPAGGPAGGTPRPRGVGGGRKRRGGPWDPPTKSGLFSLPRGGRGGKSGPGPGAGGGPPPPPPASSEDWAPGGKRRQTFSPPPPRPPPAGGGRR